MNTQLAFTYACVARIMEAGGYTMEEIRNFLVKHQNPTGYIVTSLIPNPKAR